MMYTFHMPYVEIIKQIMIEFNYSQQQIADVLGINQTTVSQWLLGKKKPTVAEKDAYILRETESMSRKVSDLKIQRDYCRRIFDIQMLKVKY